MRNGDMGDLVVTWAFSFGVGLKGLYGSQEANTHEAL